MIRPMLIPLICLTFLAGCGGLLGGGPARDAYELRGNIAPAPQAARPRALHLIVEPPIVAGSLDSDRILIRPNARQAQYLPDAAWTDTPAAMVQTALVREIDATGAFLYVGREPLGAGGDYALLTEIVDFQPEITDAGVVTHLRINARLVRESDLRIAGIRSFQARIPTANTDTANLIAALDLGMAQITGQMTGWVLGLAR